MRYVRSGAAARIAVTVALLVSFVIPPGSAFAAPASSDSAELKAEQRLEKWQEKRSRSFISQEERESAAARAKVLRGASSVSKNGVHASAAALTVPTPGGIPDYFGPWANWAYSPLIRKFVDTLPGVGASNANNLGNYIGVAHPDTVTYPGCDYYEIELREYEQQLHSDLPPTRLRGYVQTNKGTDGSNNNTIDPEPIGYMGPLIAATKDRPVRVKFTNKLPVGEGGDLFIPVDTSVMGSGHGPIEDPDMPGMGHMAMYTQNRATLHLHGGITPWISDGTPHQWITPAGEDTVYPEGVSVENVPDMPDPGDGSMTFFYSNQQSARLMWVHDHAYGITRLNVYAGEVMPYTITDDVEKQLVADGTIPGPDDTLPLIVQDKTFVDDKTILDTDPTWNWGSTPPEPHSGDLWIPHVYVPAQNPADPGGMNATGRWHYGPWFWPPTTDVKNPPIANPYYDPNGTTPWEYPLMPATPNPSMGMEAFHDTPLVNGTPYPVLEVDPKAYRLRILNGASDRFFNLQLYEADSTQVSADGRTNTEVKMVPAVPNAQYESLYPNIAWPIDGRDGGAPDPATAGPKWIQFATESGFLPAPAVIEQQPITWNGDPTTFNMGNVQDHSLLLGPAERADVVVDFSAYAGKTLILYNDAPTAFPALDARTDYYTGAPDMTDTGGTKTPNAGFGPNTRTVMQIKIKSKAPAPAFDLAALQAAFVTTGTNDGVFKKGQNPVIVPDARYNDAYNGDFAADPYVRIFENLNKTWQMLDGSSVTLPLEPKAIQDEMGESFDREYGRMSGNFGLQIPGVGGALQNFILYGFMDIPSENLVDQMTPLSPVQADGTQIWRITHNGVDTHPVHFHLYDVQLINRVGWDGALRPPDDNELGWKETVRVSPLEDTIVALKPVAPKLPFGVPDSIRPLDPTMPLGTTEQFSQVDGQGLPRSVENTFYNFGWEYVFHCHILSHEEMDMMRPVTLAVGRDLADPPNPVGATGTPGDPITLAWNDATPAPSGLTVESPFDPKNEVGFAIERAPLPDGGPVGSFSVIATATANTQSFVDETTIDGRGYSYRVRAFNASEDLGGFSLSTSVDVEPAAYFDSYVATPTAGPNGSISPSTPQSVPVGSPADRTFDFIPDTGYHIADVLVDDVSVGTPASYTFDAMDQDHTIRVEFAVNKYEITPTAGPNGQVVWANEQNPKTPPATNPMVQHDVMLQTLAFVPDPGYRVSDVTVDGNSVGRPRFYTFSRVTAPHSVHVEFELVVNAETPLITSQPGDVVVTAGAPASLSVAASVTQGTLTYQWYRNSSDSSSGGTLVTGATTATYNPPTSTPGTTYYYCVVTNTDNAATGNTTATATSDAAKVQVNAIDLASVTIDAIPAQTYTGSPITPVPTVTLAAIPAVNPIVAGADFTLTYANNTNVGTASVTLTGIGRCTGSRTTTFQVVRAPASSFVVSAIRNRAYTGKAIKPTVVVKYKGKTLSAGTHFTASYKSNIKTGTARITLTGKGNFVGSKLVTFRIVPKKSSIARLRGRTKRFTATWRRHSGASGYELAYSTKRTKGFKAVRTTASYKTVAKLRRGTRYYVKLRAYKTIGGRRYYGAWSSLRTVRTK
ncbi:MAG TPA: multicopper oxidase domain-containing protein [Coriobacteriia bacterium]|nr:multicopper oxidase domain-containing protein [Coriobacteriia bacterium]